MTVPVAPLRLYRPEESKDLKRPFRVLLCAIGRTPKVVTETVYALSKYSDENWLPAGTGGNWLPDEIIVVTTSVGAKCVTEELLDRGAFDRLLDALGRPKILFTPAQIEVVHSRGRPLEDILTPEDNAATADWFVNKIRYLTEFSNVQLHVSLAGGRKTMGFFAGYALTIFGRPDDRLSHVLVSPPYESHPDFLFPTREKSMLLDEDGQPIDARDAEVRLAPIPFARLETLTSIRGLSTDLSYAQLCTVLEGQTHLKLDLEKLEFVFSGRLVVRCSQRRGQQGAKMPARAAALYAYYAYRAYRGEGGITDADLINNTTTFDSLYECISSRHEKHIKQLAEKNLDTYRSKANKPIRDMFKDGSLTGRYVAAKQDTSLQFGIGLQRNQVEFVGLPFNLQ